MTEVKIRPAISTDLSTIMKMDHTCTSDYVWQMDSNVGEGQTGAIFREVRLPRAVSVNYPRSVTKLADEWSRQMGLLVTVTEEQLSGYIRITDKITPQVVWITDIVVAPPFRRKGIATALILSAQTWAKEKGNLQAIIETTSKNNAGICLARKLGFEYCGYNDHYYLSHDIALFFGRALE